MEGGMSGVCVDGGVHGSWTRNMQRRRNRNGGEESLAPMMRLYKVGRGGRGGCRKGMSPETGDIEKTFRC